MPTRDQITPEYRQVQAAERNYWGDRIRTRSVDERDLLPAGGFYSLQVPKCPLEACYIANLRQAMLIKLHVYGFVATAQILWRAG